MYDYKILTTSQVETFKKVKFYYITTDQVRDARDTIYKIEYNMQNLDGNFDIIDYVQGLPSGYKLKLFEESPILYLMDAHNNGLTSAMIEDQELTKEVIEHIQDINDPALEHLENGGLIEESPEVSSALFPKQIFDNYFEHWGSPMSTTQTNPRNRRLHLSQVLFNRNAPVDHIKGNMEEFISDMQKVDQYTTNVTFNQLVDWIKDNRSKLIDFMLLLNDLDEVLYEVANNKYKNNG